MDILNWPLNKIMQLPDCCFGRRWVIGVGVTLIDNNPVFDICEAAFPEVFVIWEIRAYNRGSFGTAFMATLVLGDVLPTTDAEFYANEFLLPNITSVTGVRGAFEVMSTQNSTLRRLRTPVRSSGRRLILRGIRSVTSSGGGEVQIVISSLPTEVPEWLFSA